MFGDVSMLKVERALLSVVNTDNAVKWRRKELLALV
jgi:hypothetical protein